MFNVFNYLLKISLNPIELEIVKESAVSINFISSLIPSLLKYLIIIKNFAGPSYIIHISRV